jgi:subtilisin family serine protease
MKHFGISQWVDFARGVAAGAEAQPMRDHLAEGCGECSDLAEFSSKLAQVCEGIDEITPPEYAVRNAKAIFPAQAPARSRRTMRMPVELIYDSSLVPAPAGLRATWQVGWQTLYRAGDCSLDLRIEPELASARASVIGQISNHVAPEQRMENIPVVVKSGRTVVAETRSNRFGEFQLEYEQDSRLQLCVYLGEGSKSFQVPLKNSRRNGIPARSGWAWDRASPSRSWSSNNPVKIGGNMMKTVKNLALAGLLALTFVSATFANDGFIIKTSPSAIGALASQYGLKVRSELGRGSGLYLVDVPDSGVLQNLRANPLVQTVQSNSKIGLPEGAVSAAPKQNNTKSAFGNLFKKPGYVSYQTQDAVKQINANQGQGMTGGGAGVTVAVIDTWIDPTHPALLGSVDFLHAYNAHSGNTGVQAMQETSPFIDQETSPFIDQETSPFIDQETSPFIDSTGSVVILNQETSPFIDQETSPFIDQRTLKSPYVGHGTMLAGLVHLVAPNAKILPIVAIDWQTGYGDLADIIKGIYYVADHTNAKVINMSFSVPAANLGASDAGALQTAINYAASKGIVCVASASNSGKNAAVVPATDGGVIGVGAVDGKDVKTAFSDYGPNVNIAAPGVGVISTFPFNHYAIQDGTSFSTALVSGAAAILKGMGAKNVSEVTVNLDKSADPVTSPVPFGFGRLDVFGAAKLQKK